MLLSRRAAQLRPGALLNQAAILQEACCLFACFSARHALLPYPPTLGRRPVLRMHPTRECHRPRIAAIACGITLRRGWQGALRGAERGHHAALLHEG